MRTRPTGSVPIFNLPPVVIGVSVALIGIHAVRALVLPVATDNAVIVWFSFIPGRLLFDGDMFSPDGWPARIWSFLTYSALHGDFGHLAINVVWMAAFGSVLARRFGAARFLLISGACAIAGAVLHLAFFWGEMIPMIGASAAISGHMAGVARFAFAPGGSLDRSGLRRTEVPWQVPAFTIGQTLKDRNAMIFLGVWFAINLLFGVGAGSILGEGVSVAWQAHVGGFLAGLLLFDLFDPRPRRQIGPADTAEFP